MKSIFTTMALLIGIGAFAQVTTEIEYNYMKTGYGMALERGDDVKAGYATTALGTTKSQNFTYTFTELKRKDSTIAGIIVRSKMNPDKYTNTIGGTVETYYCIPAVNSMVSKSYGWDEFKTDVKNMTEEEAKNILLWISYRMAFEMSGNQKKSK